MGCGGRLVLINGVLVYVDGALHAAEVFIHPFEGALLALLVDTKEAIAWDREKNTTYVLDEQKLRRTSPSEILIPADTPYKQEGEAPVFELSRASARIGNRVFEIREEPSTSS